MKFKGQRLLLTGVIAGSFSLGGIGWLAKGRSADSAGPRPDLMQLLDGVAQPSVDASAASSPAPSPPEHGHWRSPLTSKCKAGDPQLRQRLLEKVSQLRQSINKVAIDPTNYGERYRRDAFGNPLDPRPRLVVLHETVYGIESAINTFRTPHPRDEDQVSYHTLIGLNGKVVDVVDPAKRAYGAGNSAFRGEWAVTNAELRGSVNNFALHISLETPIDGENNLPYHSGYTAAQYDSLAALLGLWMHNYAIKPSNVTTHQVVDLGGERADPRSFRWEALRTRMESLGLLC